MYEFRKKQGILIPSKYKNSTFYFGIKGFLHRWSNSYGNKKEKTIHKFFIESDNYLLVPRFFPIDNFVNEPFKIIDESHIGKDIDITHNISPRDRIQENAINYMLKNDSGIIEMEPGSGKTVITIYVVSERKKRTLILVHRDSLANQWKNRFIEHSSLKEDDISILTSTTYNKDFKKSVIIITNQMFVSLLKRDRTNFLISLNKANIGIFIGDEVHTSVGAPTFSECSIHIPAKVTFGLSATPYRFDGNSDIITYHLGDIYQEEETSGSVNDIRVTFVLFDYGINTDYRKRYLYWGGEFQRARYLSLMRTKSPKFKSVIKELINKHKNSRHSLIIAERVKLLQELHDNLDADKAMFVSGHSLSNLKSKNVFSTPGKIRDGIDAPWKDLLILTSPISNIKQMSGRICRQHKGKKDAIIIDIVDIGCWEISKTYFIRKEFYKKKNYSIQYLGITNDNKTIKLNEKDADSLVQAEYLKRGIK